MRERDAKLRVAGGAVERRLPWLKAGLTGTIHTHGKCCNNLWPHHRYRAAYHVHRFLGVSLPALYAQLGRFGGVSAQAHSPPIFRIHNLETTTRHAAPDVSRVSATSASRITHEGAQP